MLRALPAFLTVLTLCFVWAQRGAAQESPIPLMRAPAHAIQMQRAQTAWESGVGLLEVKARVDLVLQEQANDVQALILRAKVSLAMDQPRAAYGDAMRAAELDPSAGEAHLLWAESALILNKREQAEDALRLASTHSIEDAIYHVRLSAIAVRLEQIERAESYARVALNLHADEPAAYYQLARVFVEKGYTDAAVLTLRQGFERGVLDMTSVRDDAQLARLATDEALTPWLQR